MTGFGFIVEPLMTVVVLMGGKEEVMTSTTRVLSAGLLASVVVASLFAWKLYGPNDPMHTAGTNVSAVTGRQLSENGTQLSEIDAVASSTNGDNTEPNRNLDQGSSSDEDKQSLPVGSDSTSPFFEVITKEELVAAKETYLQEMTAKGRVDDNGNVHNYTSSDLLEFFGDEAEFYDKATISDLVELGESGDARALAKLSDLAWRAGRWLEAEQLAIQAAKASGSIDPLVRLATARFISSGSPFTDRTAASLYLASAQRGDASSAWMLDFYMQHLGAEDQILVLNRAQEILFQISQGG